MEEARQHISKMMGEAGISHKVEPGLFRGCCEVMNALVPDFSINWPGGTIQKLAELKTVHFSPKKSTSAETKLEECQWVRERDLSWVQGCGKEG